MYNLITKFNNRCRNRKPANAASKCTQSDLHSEIRLPAASVCYSEIPSFRNGLFVQHILVMEFHRLGHSTIGTTRNFQIIFNNTKGPKNASIKTLI